MKTIVCEQGLRPMIPTVWSKHHVLVTLQDIMSECWYPSPTTRLPALRVKKSLAALRLQLDLNPNLSVRPPLSIVPPEAQQGLPPEIIYYPRVRLPDLTRNGTKAATPVVGTTATTVPTPATADANQPANWSQREVDQYPTSEPNSRPDSPSLCEKQHLLSSHVEPLVETKNL
ncbi:unnamed protein product [Echinostoma caproni]|uniref:PK_Tyr_Ser-Thr domain-containing protein n=1 Tax=Echinostoma caproni TaxID=27848 RepID=A0A183B694_9TREM|nr:unnamed protein product [Echinostoma caproni]